MREHDIACALAVSLFLRQGIGVKQKIIRIKSLHHIKPRASVLSPATVRERMADLKPSVPRRVNERACSDFSEWTVQKGRGRRRFAHGTVPFASCDRGAGRFIIVSVSTREQLATRAGVRPASWRWRSSWRTRVGAPAATTWRLEFRRAAKRFRQPGRRFFAAPHKPNQNVSAGCQTRPTLTRVSP
jgi:hypothetical protein